MKKNLLLILLLPLVGFAQSTISLQLDSFIRSIPEVGFSANTIRGPSWVDTTFNDSVASMYPTVLRHPPGAAPYLDWETGWFYPQSVLDTAIADTTLVMNPGWYNMDTLDLRAVVFQEALDQIEAEGLFLLNMMTANVPIQAAALRAAALDGVAINRVELGSEINRNDPFENLKYPTAGDYARACNQYIDSIKVILPDAQIAVVGENRGADSTRSWRWNDSIYSIVDSADALVWHPYLYLTNADTGFTDEQVVAYPFYRLPLIEEWRGFQDTISDLQDYELWVTEHNLYDKTDDLRYTNTWAQVLILAGMNSVILQNQLVEMLLLHNVGGIFTNFDALDVEHDFRKQGTGVYASIMHQAMWEKDAAQLIETPVSSMDSVIYYNANGTPKTVHFPKVFGWKFSNTNTEELVLTNITADTLEISVADMLAGEVSWKHWGSEGLFLPIDSISPVYVYSDTGTTVSLPPYSINVASSIMCNQELQEQTVWLCVGDSLVVGANIYLQEGVYLDTLVTLWGCDSVLQSTVKFYAENLSYVLLNEQTGWLYTDEGMSGYHWEVLYDGLDTIGLDTFQIESLFLNSFFTVTYLDENGCRTIPGNEYFYVCDIPEEEIKQCGNLMYVTDMLGRRVSIQANQLLLFIYEDGRVEKRILLE